VEARPTKSASRIGAQDRKQLVRIAMVSVARAVRQS
jgi:hypothetical protein